MLVKFSVSSDAPEKAKASSANLSTPSSLFIDRVYQEVSKRTDISICSISNFLEKLMSIVGMDLGDTVNLHEEDFFRLHPEKNYHKK